MCNLLLHSAGLTHEQGFTEVATRLLRDLLGQLRREDQTLFFTDCTQNITHLKNSKRTRWENHINVDFTVRKLKLQVLGILLFDFQVIANVSVRHNSVRLASSVLGRGTLMARQRLRIGPMTLEVEVEHRMRRQVLMYFSIVRRKACWASFVSLSTSVSSTTDKQKSDTAVLCLHSASRQSHSDRVDPVRTLIGVKPAQMDECLFYL